MAPSAGSAARWWCTNSPPPRGHSAVLVSSDRAPPEVFALEDQHLRALTHHNDALFAELTLGAVEDIAFKDKSGIEVHGQLVKPPGYVAGQRYPTILWIHGGPNGQDDHSLELWGYGPPLERQYFATHGYVVLAINYRGGTGRGAAYARAIHADWGDKEVEDLLAGVDYAIAAGHRRPAAPGGRRLELRRHPHRLRDRAATALQGRDRRRRQRQPAVHVRRR